MAAYRIITDSSADLTPQLSNTWQVQVLPLQFTIKYQTHYNWPDQREYPLSQFYRDLREGHPCKTAQVSPALFLDALEEAAKSGEDVLYIAFSSGLSGTCQTGQMAAQEVASRYPGWRCVVVDSLCASLGQGLLVGLATQHLRDNMTLAENAAQLEKERLQVCHWFTVDDLEFLRRGGRLSRPAAVVGTALHIKPVLHVDNTGRLVPVSRARGRKAAVAALAEELKRTAIAPQQQTVYISHGECLEDAQQLAEEIRRTARVKDIIIGPVGPVIGSHSGPGTLALFFLGSTR